MFIFDYVKQRRKELSLSQKQLAERTGVSVSVVRRFEANKPYNPILKQIFKMAKGLEVHPDVLFDECVWPYLDIHE